MRLKKNKYINIYIYILIIYSLACGLMSYSIGNNNFIYAIGQINYYDNNLFTKNTYLSNGVISPRFFLNFVFKIGMMLDGGNWEKVVLFIIYAGLLIFSIAVVKIADNIQTTNKFVITVILGLFFVSNAANQVGYFSTFESDSVGMSTAYFISLLGIAFALNKQYNWSYIIIAISNLVHIHEGIYGFAIITILVFIECICERKIEIKKYWAIFIYILTALVSVLPNLLTDSLEGLTQSEFVEIYANERHALHLVPSTWNTDWTIQSCLFIIIAATIKYMYEKSKNGRIERKLKLEIILFPVTWILALIIMIVGTEVLGSVTITTLFISKYFKYMGVIAYVWIISVIANLLEDKKYLIGYGLAGFTMIMRSLGYKEVFWTLILVVLIYFGYKSEKDFFKNRNENLEKLLGLTLYFAIFLIYGISYSIPFLLVLVSLYIMLTIHYLKCNIKKNIYNIIMMISLLFVVVGGLYGDIYQVKDGKMQIKSATDFVIANCGEDIYEVSTELRKSTDEEEIIIGDSKDEDLLNLQVISRRNVYASEGTPPSIKKTMAEWWDRCKKAEDLFENDIEYIVDLMKTNDIKYLLVDAENYNKIDESNEFQVFIQCEGNSCRVYKLQK